MHYRGANTRSRGRRGRERVEGTTGIRRQLREDIWAYELILSASFNRVEHSPRNSSYYLNVRRLLQMLYPNSYQNWSRFLRSQGLNFEPPPPEPQYENPPCNHHLTGQYCGPNNCEVDSKNLLLLSTVAGMEQYKIGCNFATGQHCSLHNHLHNEYENSSLPFPNFNGNYPLDDSNEDSKDFFGFTPSVRIKSEDEPASFMSI